MAIYQKTVGHDDTAEKRPVSLNDIKFLQALQSIMNTQDNMGNRDPRFWVIKGQKTVTSDSRYAEDAIIINDKGETVADSISAGILFIKRQLDDSDANTRYSMECDDTDPLDFRIQIQESGQKPYQVIPASMDELATIMNTYRHLFTDGSTFECVSVQTVDYIYPDTLFMTHKDAEAHLKVNAHNYDKTAHAYAMTAYRSPRIEQLWSLIRHTDFNQLINLLQGVT